MTLHKNKKISTKKAVTKKRNYTTYKYQVPRIMKYKNKKIYVKPCLKYPTWLVIRPIFFVLCLLVMLQDGGPLAHKVTLVTGIHGALVHGPLVVSQAALHRGLIVALVAGEGDETVLGHLVHLQAIGLGGLVLAFVAGVAFPLVDGLAMLAQVLPPRCRVGAKIS